MAFYYTKDGQYGMLDSQPMIGSTINYDEPFGYQSIPDPAYTPITEDAYNNYMGIHTGLTAEQSKYIVDPNLAAGQATLADLIKRRGAYIEETSKPYREQLFGTMSYGNPSLESDYFNAAIPQIQKDYRQAADLTNRTAGATGVGMDAIENKLVSRLNTLGQEQTIASAAKNIKQRLRERDLTTALGTVGATNEVIKGA